jgi:enterochelin esterase-like enzyme
MPRWNSFESFLADARRADSDEERQELVDELLMERPTWPWVQGRRATFIFTSLGSRRSVALNLDTVKGDPPFVPMTRLEGTSLWYITQEFQPDDLLDYLLAVDDPMTPLATETDIVGRISNYWRFDARNPLRMETAQQMVSVLRMGDARPFPDWTALKGVPRGRVYEHFVDSVQLGYKGRKLWVYTPPGYDRSGMVYPLLIFQDGQWAAGPLQMPAIADALIKHERMKPVVIAMLQSGSQQERQKEYVSNDRHYASLLTELLPFIQTHYRIDSTDLGVGGVAVGAIAAAHDALRNPAVFNGLIMISPPLGKGLAEELLERYTARFVEAKLLPRRIFQSVGRYEARARFLKPAQALRDVLERRSDTAYRFVEVGSGHGLVGFRSVIPEALAWVYPGKNAPNG